MSNTLTIQVEDKTVMAGLKKVLSAMSGVVILPTRKTKKSGIDEAMDDIHNGRVTKYDSVEDMFEKLEVGLGTIQR